MKVCKWPRKIDSKAQTQARKAKEQKKALPWKKVWQGMTKNKNRYDQQ